MAVNVTQSSIKSPCPWRSPKTFLNSGTGICTPGTSSWRSSRPKKFDTCTEENKSMSALSRNTVGARRWGGGVRAVLNRTRPNELARVGSNGSRNNRTKGNGVTFEAMGEHPVYDCPYTDEFEAPRFELDDINGKEVRVPAGHANTRQYIPKSLRSDSGQCRIVNIFS
ncbi:hypothetical protein niasHT_001495 [Heterodera trifolii]|uniref:Uncharacterized protein n=1 Tax=Heterodera trifolii TaxID=157864 RepID=A0ABD2MEL4_9BILA